MNLLPGQRLRAWRAQRRISRENLALRLGCSPQQLSEIERGEEPAPVYMYELMLNAGISSVIAEGLCGAEKCPTCKRPYNEHN